MNERLIHDYLEGELDISGQEFLFSEMRSKPELRTELDNQLNFQKIVQFDKSKSIPPIELTASLFSNLGYSIPLNGNYINAQKLNRKWKYAFLMFVFMLVTIPSLILMKSGYFDSEGSDSQKFSNNGTQKFNSSTNSSVSGILNENKSTENGLQSSVDANHYNLSDNKGINNSSKIYKISNAINSNYGVRQKNSLNDISLNADDKSILENSDAGMKLISTSQFVSGSYDFNSVSSITNNNSNANGYRLNFPNNTFNFTNTSELFPRESNYEINLQAKNNITNQPNVSLTTNNELTDNFNAGIWYNFHNNGKLGIEFGRESFSQNFITKDKIYNQVPTLTFIGVGYRYNATELELPLNIVPFGQLVTSATTIGPIVKAQTGLILGIYSPVSFNIGLEYGMLFYNVNSSVYSSSKFNLTGGIVIRL